MMSADDAPATPLRAFADDHKTLPDDIKGLLAALIVPPLSQSTLSNAVLDRGAAAIDPRYGKSFRLVIICLNG